MIDVLDPTPKQIDLIRNTNYRINLATGAVRSGKTVGLNLRWLEYVMKSAPPGDLLMFGKTERTLKRNILSPIQELLGQDYFRINYGEGEAYLGRRKIYIAGASDERAEGKIRGMTLAGAYGDELVLTPLSFFNMLLSRLSVKGAKFFGTTNPEGPYHWLKTDYIDRSSDLDMGVFQFELEDNTHLDRDYVSSLKKEYTGVFYQRYINGLWVLAEGIIYDVWDKYRHMGEIIDPYEFSNYIVGIDYGTSNPCTFGLYGFDKHLPAYLIKEYWYEGGKEGVIQKTDGQYADDLEEFLGNIHPEVIYIDPSALSFIVELRQRNKYKIKAGKNDVLPGIQFISKLLNNDLYFVDEKCIETDKGYSSYVWNPNKQKTGLDEPLKENDHVCDRDRYALFTHFYRKYFATKQKHWK